MFTFQYLMTRLTISLSVVVLCYYSVSPCRHENGMVKFWDITNGAMRLIYELKTSNLFVGQEPESALMEEFSEFKWPPYRKVSVFDPFEDDPRLAIKLIEFCPNSSSLCIGGNGGQVISFSLNPSPSESALEVSHCFLYPSINDVRSLVVCRLSRQKYFEVSLPGGGEHRHLEVPNDWNSSLI